MHIVSHEPERTKTEVGFVASSPSIPGTKTKPREAAFSVSAPHLMRSAHLNQALKHSCFKCTDYYIITTLKSVNFI